MIVLDTHVWVWWVHGSAQLPAEYQTYVDGHVATAVGVSAISCWEVAKLVERGRLVLPCPTDLWVQQALGASGIQVLALSPEVAVESTTLPGVFHRDPADQIIVATTRTYKFPLVTMDQKMRSYAHVQTAP